MEETLPYSYEPLRFSRLKSLQILSFKKPQNLPPASRSPFSNTDSENIPLEMAPKLKGAPRQNSAGFRRAPQTGRLPVSAGFGIPIFPLPVRILLASPGGSALPLGICPGKWANGRSAVSEESVGLIID